MFNEKEIEKIISYTFTNKALLKKAFTHPSCDNQPNYQRLEFLGDSLLNYIVSKELFSTNKIEEGGLTNLRRGIVSAGPLCEVIKASGLDKYILRGKNDNYGEVSDKNKSDIFEALTAAIMLDGGINAAEKFVLFMLKDKIENPESFKDYKTELKEFCEKNKLELKYSALEKSGPAHKPQFMVSVSVDGDIIGAGTSGRKGDAEQSAAAEALKKVHKNSF